MDEILKILAGSLRGPFEKAEIPFESLQEIRLRAGLPIFLRIGGREYGLKRDGGLAEAKAPAAALRTAKEQELKETLEYAGNYSLYAYEDELRQGYLTIRGGHRVGVAGRAVSEGGRIQAMRFVSFLNIRLAHQVKGCARALLPWLWEKDALQSALILSPPGGGKTTLLRDLIRLISEGTEGRPGRTVAVADERSELAACFRGIPQNDLGPRTDVMDGCPKAEGLSMLIRSMSPEAAAVDEIGGEEELLAVRNAALCGCRILATAHGSSREELFLKKGFQRLFEEGIFSRLVVLAGSGHPGTPLAVSRGDGTLLWKREA